MLIIGKDRQVDAWMHSVINKTMMTQRETKINKIERVAHSPESANSVETVDRHKQRRDISKKQKSKKVMKQRSSCGVTDTSGKTER